MVKLSRFAKIAKTAKVFPLECFDVYGIMKTSYSLQRLRVMVMFYVLETWQAIIIINDKWHSEKKENTEEEAKRIVCAAAN